MVSPVVYRNNGQVFVRYLRVAKKYENIIVAHILSKCEFWKNIFKKWIFSKTKIKVWKLFAQYFAFEINIWKSSIR